MICARGAMPEISPYDLPKSSASTPALPAAVDAVCVPWPSSSRAESNSSGSAPTSARYVCIIWRAPISLLLHSNGASFGLCAVLPNSHAELMTLPSSSTASPSGHRRRG